MRLLLSFLVTGLMLPINLYAAKRVNVLWIGNSLTQAPGCWYEGWLASTFMANSDSLATGINVASYKVMYGATSLATHWANQHAFAELDNPVVRPPSNPFTGLESIDHYDYLVLQTYKPGTGAGLTAESTAICNYSDLALSKGTKPIIFACWDIPASYAGEMKAFDSCYVRYKSRGALIAPLYDIHASIWPEKPLSYLYLPNDDYHHETINGVYINMCVFNYLFTGMKPTHYDYSLLSPALSGCADIAAIAPEKDYLAAKVEAGLAKYYDGGGTAVADHHLKIPTTRIAESGGNEMFDIAGRYIMTGRTFRNVKAATVCKGIYLYRNAGNKPTIIMQ
jgi:hypothetical protein